MQDSDHSGRYYSPVMLVGNKPAKPSALAGFSYFLFYFMDTQDLQTVHLILITTIHIAFLTIMAWSETRPWGHNSLKYVLQTDNILPEFIKL